MTYSENFIAFKTLLGREIARFLRIWVQTIVPSVINVILYFVIFGSLMGDKIGDMNGVKYIQYIVPGLIMMAIINNSYSNVVSSFFGAKFQRHIEEMIVSPMPPNLILAGFVLGGVARGACVGIIVTLTTQYFTPLPVPHLGLTLLVGIMTATLFSLAGFINGLCAKKFDDISIVPTFILSPLTYFGGVFYSADLIQNSFWKGMMYCNPIFYMINAFRFSMLGHSDVPIRLSLGLILGFTLIIYLLAYKLFNKGLGARI